jgi:SpoVK/Ycf46/Vps4 family AAA+-type ATPase
VARVLAPAAVVVEDVDLIAQERTHRSGEHPLLFQLLNEMEGLNSASDVIFLLTTNRADGVTAPFLKELLRKAALLAADADLADAANTAEAAEAAGVPGRSDGDGVIRVCAAHVD